MEINLPLKQMSIEQKFQVMETIWDDLCKRTDNIPSPIWHKNILDEREQQLKIGEDEFIDWNTAKKKIRDSVS